MNDLLQEKLQIIAQTPYYVEALKSLFYEKIGDEKPKVADWDDNLLLGQKYRAYEAAKKMIDDTFTALAGYKQLPKKSNFFNKER